MVKLLYAVLGVFVTVGLSAGTWWVNGVNAHCKVVDELQFKDKYLNGAVPAAPVTELKK